jgi:hypothetical protein
MSHLRGDVVLALFPHAESSPPKARPVLVIQSDHDRMGHALASEDSGSRLTRAAEGFEEQLTRCLPSPSKASCQHHTIRTGCATRISSRGFQRPRKSVPPFLMNCRG